MHCGTPRLKIDFVTMRCDRATRVIEDPRATLRTGGMCRKMGLPAPAAEHIPIGSGLPAVGNMASAMDAGRYPSALQHRCCAVSLAVHDKECSSLHGGVCNSDNGTLRNLALARPGCHGAQCWMHACPVLGRSAASTAVLARQRRRRRLESLAAVDVGRSDRALVTCVLSCHCHASGPRSKVAIAAGADPVAARCLLTLTLLDCSLSLRRMCSKPRCSGTFSR